MRFAKTARVLSLKGQKKSFWQNWRFTLMSMAVIAGTIFATFAGFGYYAAKTIEVECLARRLDMNLDTYGTLKGADFSVFKQQAEAAARVHIKRHAEQKETLCPQGKVMPKLQWLRQSVTGSFETSARMQILRPIAEQAVRGRYEFDWPSEYACVNRYRATRLRLPIWGAQKVGTIGNMSLYCEDDKGV